MFGARIAQASLEQHTIPAHTRWTGALRGLEAYRLRIYNCEAYCTRAATNLGSQDALIVPLVYGLGVCSLRIDSYLATTGVGYRDSVVEVRGYDLRVHSLEIYSFDREATTCASGKLHFSGYGRKYYTGSL